MRRQNLLVFQVSECDDVNFCAERSDVRCDLHWTAKKVQSKETHTIEGGVGQILRADYQEPPKNVNTIESHSTSRIINPHRVLCGR